MFNTQHMFSRTVCYRIVLKILIKSILDRKCLCEWNSFRQNVTQNEKEAEVWKSHWWQDAYLCWYPRHRCHYGVSLSLVVIATNMPGHLVDYFGYITKQQTFLDFEAVEVSPNQIWVDIVWWNSLLVFKFSYYWQKIPDYGTNLNAVIH